MDVDAYIAEADPEARPILTELRALIKATLPEVEEGISWGVPFYKYHGALAGFAVYKNHVSFGLTTPLQGEDRRLLEQDGYVTGKKTVQIKFGQSVPVTAIEQVLRAEAARLGTR